MGGSRSPCVVPPQVGNPKLEKLNEQAMSESQNGTYLMASNSVPASRILPWIPAMTSLIEGLWSAMWNIPFTLQVAFGCGLYHSYRKQNMTLTNQV